ncbi:MAG: hypothetical protein ACSHYF_11225 [Verrucomicrobiaceae bacterium]
MVSVLLAGLFTVQADGSWQTTFAAIGGIIFVILHTILLFSLVFVVKTKRILTTMLNVAVDLSTQATKDLATLQQKQQDGSLETPTFGELFHGIMHIVALPIFHDVLKNTFPILSRLLTPLTNRLGTSITQKALKNVPEKKQQSSLNISPGKLLAYQEMAAKIKHASSKIITASSWFVLLPSLLGLLILWTIATALYVFMQ